jgi:sensor histidine kinase regulating citrate/malate metabolism
MRLIYELVELSTLKLSNQKLKFQVKQAEFTYESNERIRKLRHELKNKFFTIETLLENGNYDELKHFIDKEIGAPLDSSMVINTGSHLLDMILTQKSTEAHQKNLPFRMDILLSSLPALDDHQLSSLMFNLLDNAFEASEHTDNPDIYLHIWPQKGYTWIQLKNKCSSSVLSVNPNLCTVKPDKEGHGFGIGIIRGIVSEAGGKIAFGEKDNYFVVSIMLPAQNDSYQ